jgi:DNA (cytosine-5)-methyltransferase 1
MLTRKIGLNRGNPRLWLEGKCLIEFGFNHSDRFYVTNLETVKPCLMITKAFDGNRKVAGNTLRPIIDINGAKILDRFESGDIVSLTLIGESILINSI